MKNYIEKLSYNEINGILQKCNLEAVRFNNSETIRKCESGFFIVCIKKDSTLYKDVLEWSHNRNSNGELIISYISKSDYKEFVLLYITDYFIKILNKKISSSKLETEINNILILKLNSYFLEVMLEKFKNTSYKNEFCIYKKV